MVDLIEIKCIKRLAVIFTLSTTVVLVLYCGNPQANRWFYVCQAYLFHKDVDPYYEYVFISNYKRSQNRIPIGPIKVPDTYTGKWEFWNEYGNRISLSHFKEGVLVGVQTEYHTESKAIVRQLIWEGGSYKVKRTQPPDNKDLSSR